MRHRIWLLALVAASMSLACTKKEEASDASPAAAATATPRPTYTLKVTFEGLVGYLNQRDKVWALLPKAGPDTMPSGFDPNKLDDYPQHYAFLKVDGANVKDFEVPGDVHIPIDGKAIEISVGSGTGSSGIPPDKFRQPQSDPVDQLDSAALTSPHKYLAARVKLPLIDVNDWVIDETEDNQTPKFVNVTPTQATGYCKAPAFTNPTEPRVQAVTWQMKNLTGDVTLNLSTLSGVAVPPLVLTPTNGQNTIQVWIVNKEWQALYDPSYVAHHWPAYRWFYNLSNASVQSDCTKHYYPQGQLGGNRCPQKLYSE
jgi:hypothetical protein